MHTSRPPQKTKEIPPWPELRRSRYPAASPPERSPIPPSKAAAARQTKNYSPLLFCAQTTRPGKKSKPAWQIRTAEQKMNRSEEHTSELQSHVNLVCRLLLEKKTISHSV